MIEIKVNGGTVSGNADKFAKAYKRLHTLWGLLEQCPEWHPRRAKLVKESEDMRALLRRYGRTMTQGDVAGVTRKGIFDYLIPSIFKKEKEDGRKQIII